MPLYGYARVSTLDQNLGLQRAALQAASCQVIRAETASGSRRDGRIELQPLLDFVQPGDTLVVTRIDRLARSLKDSSDVACCNSRPSACRRCCAQDDRLAATTVGERDPPPAPARGVGVRRASRRIAPRAAVPVIAPCRRPWCRVVRRPSRCPPSMPLPSALRPVPLVWSALLGAGAAGARTTGAQAAAAAVPAPLDFRGRLLVVLSDADMVASAYIDGRLGPPRGADALTVVRLDRVRGRARPLDALAVGRIAVSNSVTGPPAAVAVTPDGRYAVVVETLGPRRTDRTDARLRDLPLGRMIVVVDLGDPDHPAVVQRVACPPQPETVAINAAGSRVAVTFGPAGAGPTTPLLLYRFRDGRLSGGVAPAAPGWPAGHPVRDAEFAPAAFAPAAGAPGDGAPPAGALPASSPPGDGTGDETGDVLALLDATTPAVAFVRVAGIGTGATTTLTPWGPTVTFAQLGGPFLVRWAPDGRHVVVNGNDTDPAAGPDDGYGRPRGVVVSVRVGTGAAAGARVVGRAVVGRTVMGAGPEGLAVSPDGRWVATSNLERSYLPLADPRQTLFASLSLARLDPATGVLARVGDFPFDGVLPETVLFDNSSRYVAATTFDRFDGDAPGGSLDVWRLALNPTDTTHVALIKTTSTIPVPRGAHTMVIAR